MDHDHLQQAAKDHLWMHFTRHGQYDESDVPIIVKGEGAYIWDAKGRRYLDGLAGLFVSQLGHGRTDLAETAARQASELAFPPLWSYAHPTAPAPGPAPRVHDPLTDLAAARPHAPDAPPPTDGPLPWLPGIPARLAEAHDWGPFTAAYHQLVREQIDAVREQARGWTGATAPVWAQPFLEDEDADLRADLAVWRAVAGTDENDLRPTGDRTIGAPGA